MRLRRRYSDIVSPQLVVASAQASGLPAPSDEALNAPVLSLGSSGTAVTTLQTDLGMVGSQYAVAIDGQFGPNTAAAVQQFQSDQGLLISGSPVQAGVVDANTWNAIQNASSFTTVPAGNAPVPGTGQWLSQVIQSAPAPVVKAASATVNTVAPNAPDWVLPAAVVAFSVGGLALVGGVAWWVFKPHQKQ